MLSDEKERDLANLEALKYLNQVRLDPKSLIPNLEELLTYFVGDGLIQYPGTTYRVITHEGPAAVQECIDYLNQQLPVCELKYSKGLSQACLDHVQDIGPKGFLQHQGTDKSQPKDRVLRYGKGSYIGENISSGTRSGIQSMIDLLVDDDVPSRGHRKNIFVKDYRFVGINNGIHKKYGFVFVYDFAGDYEDNPNLSKMEKYKQQSRQNKQIKADINENKRSPIIILQNKQIKQPIQKSYQIQNQPQNKSKSPQNIKTNQKSNTQAPKNYSSLSPKQNRELVQTKYFHSQIKNQEQDTLTTEERIKIYQRQHREQRIEKQLQLINQQSSNQDKYEILNQQLFEFINLLRSDPQLSIKEIEQLKKCTTNKQLIFKNTNPTTIQLKEGVSSMNDCIKFLQQQKPVDVLQQNEILKQATTNHGLDSGVRGNLGHIGFDGSNVQTRVLRYCTYKGPLSETISYGYNDPKQIILMHLIDDGYANKEHRNIYFNKNFKQIGIYSGPHAKYQYMTIITLAQEIIPKLDQKEII